MMLSKHRFTATLLTLLLAGAAAAATDPVKDLTLVDVSPSVVMAENPNGSNLACIALDEGLVFIDAGLHTEAAAAFREQMEARFERPASRLILTHGHVDHIFGMGAFADVPVVAAAIEKPLFERQLAMEWTEKAVAAWAAVFPTFPEAVPTARPFMPTDWVEGERTFGPPGREIFFATTGGHTTGSSYIWFPNERVLVAGDLVQVDKYPYFGDPTNDLDAWITALDRWTDMSIKAVCPGHGRVVGADYLRLEREYFANLISAMTSLKAEGATLEDAVTHASLPDGYWDPDLPEPRWWKYCLATYYRSLE